MMLLSVRNNIRMGCRQQWWNRMLKKVMGPEPGLSWVGGNAWDQPCTRVYSQVRGRLLVHLRLGRP